MAVKQNDMNDRTVPVSAVRKSFKLQTLIAALVIVVTSLAWFTAPPTAAAAEAQQFGDWILRCETKGEGELCYLHQTINYSKGDVSGVRLDIKIGALADDDDLYALLMLPLGLNIPSGAIIGADAGEPTPPPHDPDLYQGRLPFDRQNIQGTALGISQRSETQSRLCPVRQHPDDCGGGLPDWLYRRL